MAILLSIGSRTTCCVGRLGGTSGRKMGLGDMRTVINRAVMLIRWIRVWVEGSGHADIIAYALFRIRFASSGQPPHAAGKWHVSEALARGFLMLEWTSVLSRVIVPLPAKSGNCTFGNTLVEFPSQKPEQPHVFHGHETRIRPRSSGKRPFGLP